MITTLIIASFITLFIRATDEDKPLRKLFALYASKLNKDKFLYKATVGCLECRILWLAIVLNTSFSFVYDWKYLFFIPLTWICSIYMTKIIE